MPIELNQMATDGQCLPESFREKDSKPKVPEKTGSEKKIQKKMSQCSDMWANPR